MDPIHLNIDRRRFKRYPVLHGAFAVLRPEKKSSKLGSIINISKGGLAFHLLDMKENMPHFSELDIYVTGKGLFLKNVPLRVISEIALPKEIPFYAVITRRIGIEFDQMTDNNVLHLEHFIQNHTLGESLPDTPA